MLVFTFTLPQTFFFVVTAARPLSLLFVCLSVWRGSWDRRRSGGVCRGSWERRKSGGVWYWSWDRRSSGGVWRGSWDRRRSGLVLTHLQPPHLQLRVHLPQPCCIDLPLGPLWSLPRHRPHPLSSLDALSESLYNDTCNKIAMYNYTKYCVHVRGRYSNVEKVGNLIGNKNNH